ncbi:MAG: glycosyltransferase 4 family protein [Candidatus Woesearchaeota archaeon]
MVDIFLILSLIATFFASIILVDWWIKKANKVGLVGKDMNKLDKAKVAEVGGLPVLFAFLFGLLIYTGHRTYIQNTPNFHIPILGVISTVLIIGIIGIVDDILGWKLGLRQWQKPLLGLFAALPLMMTNAGISTISIPIIGDLNLGFFYPLIIIPIAITGAANGFNLLAGYNGLEAGQGVIILSIMAYISWIIGNPTVTMIALIMVAALLGFLFFNRYPSKVFPGDTLTYTVGALIAVLAIIGNMEKVALILFIPYFIEVILLFRAGNTSADAFAHVHDDGSLDLKYDKIFDTTHAAIVILKKFKRKVHEKDVVYMVWGWQLLFGILAVVYLYILPN